MFTHSFQLSVFILFHCNIHVRIVFSLSSCVFEKLWEKPKIFLASSFPCWELSRVNSFSHFSFSSLICFLQEKPKTPKIFQCVSLKFFSFYLSRTEEKTTMKLLSGSHLHYHLPNKEPILPCHLLLNIMFADSSLVHGILALLLFSYHSVVQVKGNNDDIWWIDCGREKRVWTQLIFVFVNMFSLVSLIQHIMIKHVCNDN